MRTKDDERSVAELPFDPMTMDVVCRRVPTGERDLDGREMLRTQTNINQAVISHSPDGFEWGYGGSGPADFALNILNVFVRTGSDGFAPVKCHSGHCSSTAWALHQEFKAAFIAGLPRMGTTIRGEEIRNWIDANRSKVKCGDCYANPCVCSTFMDEMMEYHHE